MTTPHLDDEALSAGLDGAATASEEAHLASCPQCRAQTSALAAIARAVGTPIGPRPAREVDDAVQRALAAWEPAATAAPSLAEPAAMADGGGWEPDAPSASHRWAGRPASRRRVGPPRWLGPVAGIAAAILVVGGVAVVLNASTRPSSKTTAATPTLGAASSLAPRRDFAVPSGGDLGDQSDPKAVARLATASITSRPVAAPAIDGNPSQPSPAGCQAQAQDALRLAQGSDVTLAYQASLRWRGQPAVVVVFSRSGGLAGVVMTVPGCSPLAVLPF